MPTWPATLPQTPFDPGSGSPQYKPTLDNSVRSQVDAGPAKMRRRFTTVPETVDITLVLSEAELADLKTFYETTLLDVTPFDWIDFRTGLTASYRFLKRPSESWHSADLWSVSLSLEKLP